MAVGIILISASFGCVDITGWLVSGIAVVGAGLAGAKTGSIAAWWHHG